MSAALLLDSDGENKSEKEAVLVGFLHMNTWLGYFFIQTQNIS